MSDRTLLYVTRRRNLARQRAQRAPARQLAIGWITGTLTSAAGLAISFAFDWPTGAAMVCAVGGALAGAALN
jgi:ABC-type Mn2+/Zn2+ transport system permease subunit